MRKNWLGQSAIGFDLQTLPMHWQQASCQIHIRSKKILGMRKFAQIEPESKHYEDTSNWNISDTVDSTQIAII